MVNKPNAVNATTVAKVLALSLFLGGSGVGYVFQKGQIDGLKKQEEANVLKIYDLSRRSDNLKVRLAGVTSRAQLELAGRHFQLQLRMPDPGQVITLPEPRLERAAGIKLANQP